MPFWFLIFRPYRYDCNKCLFIFSKKTFWRKQMLIQTNCSFIIHSHIIRLLLSSSCRNDKFSFDRYEKTWVVFFLFAQWQESFDISICSKALTFHRGTEFWHTFVLFVRPFNVVQHTSLLLYTLFFFVLWSTFVESIFRLSKRVFFVHVFFFIWKSSFLCVFFACKVRRWLIETFFLSSTLIFIEHTWHSHTNFRTHFFCL